MKCPSAVLLEDQAEGLLSGREAEEVAAHVRDCVACRRSLEERRRFLDACRSLPPLALPSGFTRGVLEKAFPRPRRKRRLWPYLAAGTASLALATVLLVASGVCDLPTLMTSSGKLVWRGLQEGASFGAKAVRLVLALFHVAAQLLRFVWLGIEALTGAVPRQLPALALASLAAMAGFFVFGYRKLFVRR